MRRLGHVLGIWREGRRATAQGAWRNSAGSVTKQRREHGMSDTCDADIYNTYHIQHIHAADKMRDTNDMRTHVAHNTCD